MSSSKFCQSCSMPLNDAEQLGTEKDGSTSLDFCKFCYNNGEFTHPDLTLDQMIKRMTRKMEGKHLPEDILEAAVERLPTLKRWRS